MYEWFAVIRYISLCQSVYIRVWCRLGWGLFWDVGSTHVLAQPSPRPQNPLLGSLYLTAGKQRARSVRWDILGATTWSHACPFHLHSTGPNSVTLPHFADCQESERYTHLGVWVSYCCCNKWPQSYDLTQHTVIILQVYRPERNIRDISPGGYFKTDGQEMAEWLTYMKGMIS